MAEIDYKKLDKLLKELYVGDRQYPVMIGETYTYLFKDEPDYDDDDRDYASYMAELSGLDLATERETSGTIMDITPLGRQVHKAGGWLAYNAQIKEKDDDEKAIRLKEVEATLLSADAGKKSMYAAYIAIFISTAFALWQFVDGSSKQTEIDLINKKLRVLDSLSTLQLRSPKPMIPPLDSSSKNGVLKHKR